MNTPSTIIADLQARNAQLEAESRIIGDNYVEYSDRYHRQVTYTRQLEAQLESIRAQEPVAYRHRDAALETIKAQDEQFWKLSNEIIAMKSALREARRTLKRCGFGYESLEAIATINAALGEE